MPDFIESIAILLGLDGSAFVRGQKKVEAGLESIEQTAGKTQEAIDKGQKTGVKKTETSQNAMRQSMRQTGVQAGRTASIMKSKGHEASSFFDSLSDGAMKFLALVGAIKGVQEMIRLSAETGQLGYLAKNIGINPQQFAAIGMAAQRYYGGTQAEAEGAVAALQEKLLNWKFHPQEMSPMLALLQRWGGSAQDSVSQNLNIIADHLSKLPQQQAYNIATEQFGMPANLANLLISGNYGADLKSVQSDAPTQADIDAAQKFNTQLVTAEQGFDALAREIEGDFGPALSNLLGLFERFASEIAGPVSGVLKDYGKFYADLTAGKLKDAEADLKKLSGDWLSGAKDIAQGLAQGGSDIGQAEVNIIESASKDLAAKPIAYNPPPLPPGIAAKVRAAAIKEGLDPNFMVALATAEGGTGKVSATGNIGTMQISPAIAKQYGVDPYNEDQNILGGMEYFKSITEKFGGNLLVSAAAYNEGPNGVGIENYYKTSVPDNLSDETKSYLGTILDIYGGIPPQGINPIPAGQPPAASVSPTPTRPIPLAPDVLKLVHNYELQKAADKATQAVHQLHQIMAIQSGHRPTTIDNSVQTETHIGQVTIHTQSTRPDAIRSAIESIGTAAGRARLANTGLS